ncbi:ABC-type transport system involved in cytochrome bd biosynthesis fused ATPase/permease subunit [Agrobacterium vitis]|nr:ABC-type transport system involved in cytochrome bd biosynthesis fused ATPase/permease subunit [Agrobacterium vitis]MBE1439484.1 ABC-type transport system involved in cytochrome bd biosynthesis fused ATPase/permease subunit [Agrobacterium vitis]
MRQEARTARNWPLERVRGRRVRFAAPLQAFQDPGPLAHEGPDPSGIGPSSSDQRINMLYPAAPAQGFTLRRWISRWPLAATRQSHAVDGVLAHLPVLGSLMPFLLLQAPDDVIRLGLIIASLCLFAGVTRSRIRLKRNQTVAIHGRFWDQLLSSPPSHPAADDCVQDRHGQVLRLRLALEGALCVAEHRGKMIASALFLLMLHCLIAWSADQRAVCLMLAACASTALFAAILQTCCARWEMQKAMKAEHLTRLQNRLATHLPLLRQMGQAESFRDDLEKAHQDYSAHAFLTRCLTSLTALAPFALAGGWLAGICINRLPLTVAGLAELLLLGASLHIAIRLGVSTAHNVCGRQRVEAASSDMPPLSGCKDGGKIESLSRICLTNIGFSHDDASDMVLRDVSLSLNTGEVIALTGPSGSGKSTFLSILMGLVTPQVGTISVNDQPCLWADLSRYRARIAGVFQDTILGFSTLRTAISLNATHLTTDDILQAADDAGLGDAIAALPMGLETLIVEGGFPHSLMQQVLIAQGLAQNPDLLVLDETFSTLSTATASDIIAAVRRRNITLVFATHRADLAALADRVLPLGVSCHG